MLKKIDLLWFCATIAMICILFAIEAQSQTLPPPPTIGKTAPTSGDPLGYMIGAIRVLLLLGFLVLSVIGMMTYGGGMVAELNNARARGEWGRFGVYTIAGLFVIVVIIFAGWWAADYLGKALATAPVTTTLAR